MAKGSPAGAKRGPSTLDDSGPAAVVTIRLSPRHRAILDRVARQRRVRAADVIRGWLDDVEESAKSKRRRRSG